MFEDKGFSFRRLDGPSRRVVRRPQAPPAIPAPSQTIAAPEPEVAVGLATSKRSKFSRLRRLTRREALIGGAAALLLLAIVPVVWASQHVITHNANPGAPALAGEIDPTKLRGEGDGRINILLLGVGGPGHEGASLSDTVMVASIDPRNKNVAMLSIPRDLYVKIPGYGYGKINAANSYGGPDLTKQVVSKILDLPVHYYVHMDFAGFKQAVDAIGGVDVNNETRLSDSSFPCDKGRKVCPFILPVGQYHMDGTLALKYSRCRHGTCGNDFGRASRQQQVLVALRQKALSVSTLTNPVKLTGLVSNAGQHLRTDLQINEIQKLAKIIKDLDTSKINQRVLDDSEHGLLVTGSGKLTGNGSILVPSAGDFDYSEIQQLAHSIFVDGYLKQEGAAIEVQNGSLKSGLAAVVTKQLLAYNYNVTATTTAPENHPKGSILDYTSGKKPYTIKYLEARFGVKAQKMQKTGSSQGPDIVIILGNNYKGVAAASR